MAVDFDSCPGDQPTKQQQRHSHIKGTPAKLVGIIVDASDEQTAIARAMEVYELPPNGHSRLIALLRGNEPQGGQPPRGH